MARGYFAAPPKPKRKPRGYFLGGLFSGEPSSQTTNSSSTSSTNYAPWYESYVQNILGRANDASQQPYKPYTGEAVAPVNATQTSGINTIAGANGSYAPYTTAAGNALNAAGNIDVQGAGMPYVTNAGGLPTGSNAASGYFGAAAGTLPSNIQQYMSPYTSAVTDRIAQLGNQNLMENILPGVNDVFTGAQFGRDRHADFTGRAIRDTQNTILGQQAGALEQGYGTAAQNFQADQARLAGLGSASGALANSDISTQGALGATASGIANTAQQGQIGVGNAQGNLGFGVQGAGIQGGNALLGAGQVQQQTQQAQDTFNANQFQQQQLFPYQQIAFLNQAQSGLQIPSTTNTTGSSTQNATGGGGSPFGNILGGATAIASMFGHAEGGHIPENGYFSAGGRASVVKGLRHDTQEAMPNILQRRNAQMQQPVMRAKGGHFSRQQYADGGGVDRGEEIRRRFHGPIDMAWDSLPPDVRRTYRDGASSMLELTPMASLRDYVDSSRGFAGAAMSGDPLEAILRGGETALSVLGMMPGAAALRRARAR